MELTVSFPEGKEYDVVGLGLNAVDHLLVVDRFPERGSEVAASTYRHLGGGQVATAINTCARFGLKSKYIGKVGSDDAGRITVESLRAEGIDTASVIVEPGAYNQFAVIIIDGVSGERTILWDRDPRLSFRPGELRREEVTAGKLLHLDGHDVAASLAAARWAGEAGVPVSIDIDEVKEGIEELVAEIDLLIVSADFPEKLTGISDREAALRELARRARGFACMTLGARGAAAYFKGEMIYSPGFKVRAVDTTGAGDVFRGAFIYALFQGWGLERTLRFANATAALSCTRIGARPSIPDLGEVAALLEST